MSDLINREKAIDALWKALYEYEDGTEKQFQESEDLDVGDWIGHRIFVQNMSDIDRQTILNLPSVDAAPVIRCKDCKYYRADGDCWHEWDNDGRIYYQSVIDEPNPDDYCSKAERKEE